MEEQSLNDMLEEVRKNSQNPELVKDNKFYFEYDAKWYRVRMPNQKELAEANNKRNSTRVLLAKKGNKEGFYFKNDLIEALKESNVYIEKMDEAIKKFHDEFVQLAITANKTNENREEEIKRLEEKAKEIKEEIQKIIDKKAEHLAPCIEYQSEDVWYKYLVAKCTEGQIEEDKWENVWESFEVFGEDISSLPYVAEAHIGILLQ